MLYVGKRHHDSVHAVCSLCAQDIYAGETLWYRNGVTVCADCFPRFAREALRSFEYILGGGEHAMTLYQMSFVYREDALRFRMRITVLREQAKAAPTKEERERLKRRILELQQLQRQSRELAELTRHYYERGYYRNEKYTL